MVGLWRSRDSKAHGRSGVALLAARLQTLKEELMNYEDYKQVMGTRKCHSSHMGVPCDGCEGHYKLPDSPHFQRVGVNALTWTDKDAV